MQGYHVSKGYMGYVFGEGYRLFETEQAYYEWEEDNRLELYTYYTQEEGAACQASQR